MTSTTRVAVLGSGAWGTAFAMVMADAGNDVTLWGRDPEVIRAITEEHANPKRLPGVTLPPMRATTDPAEALTGAQIVVVAVPAQVARTTLAPMRSLVGQDAIVVSLMKGVELDTDKRMSEVLSETLDVPAARVSVVSGPNLAREIAGRQIAASVVAATDENVARFVSDACSTSYFRPYTNDDVVGVELCGAVKNVIALAVGMAHGQGLGWNTTASLITRGLVEITRLGIAMGARAETFAGLAGMGDLVATCASPLSRNHTLGKYLGQGLTLEEALQRTGGTAEGVKTSASVLDLARKHGVEMPITAGVVGVVAGDLPVEGLGAALLARPIKSETD